MALKILEEVVSTEEVTINEITMRKTSRPKYNYAEKMLMNQTAQAYLLAAMLQEMKKKK